MLWFLMGYTSKLAGTETGIVEPKTTFSRFFGEPFMPRNPDVYARMLGEKLAEHGTDVYLVNTGWSGGPYGEADRMDITLTRAMVHAALSGQLAGVEYDEDARFHVSIPRSCPGVPSDNGANAAVCPSLWTWHCVPMMFVGVCVTMFPVSESMDET